VQGGGTRSCGATITMGGRCRIDYWLGGTGGGRGNEQIYRRPGCVMVARKGGGWGAVAGESGINGEKGGVVEEIEVAWD
jgi:hypothetical protein